jgi:hypothetical protein
MQPKKSTSAIRRTRRVGRPWTFRVGDLAYVTDEAPEVYQGREALITEIGIGSSEYRVEFEDGRRPTTGYLMAWWLEPR